MGTLASVHVIALTPAGAALGQRLCQHLPGAQLQVPAKLQSQAPSAQAFTSLRDALARAFQQRTPVVAIMATGIVVRHLAPLVRGKDVDPAVVVMDERGRFAISLLSGHLGGANALAATVAAAVGATPVITTASDVQGLPALDTLAAGLGLVIENLPQVKTIQMAWLTGQKVRLVDPQGYLAPALAPWADRIDLAPEDPQALRQPGPAVYVGCWEYPWPAAWLRLRPKNLIAGVGCNKGTAVDEILLLLEQTLARHHLSRHCLGSLATITIKQHEAGLIAAARRLGVVLQCFPPEELASIKVPNPSPLVQRHLGVASVCEAAALKAAGSNTLLVPKQKSANVTVAIAQVGSGSSASVPAPRST
ncbi:MAG: cobalt-precorrin 5A hydrolase [Desulfobacca sp.]|uniref:cobalt-precorrin 5A hydrolase n=1 Tax=Desulfobacca sp. TaxID=2067990 RepID=UPI00404B0994